jgi:hypothetical protein
MTMTRTSGCSSWRRDSDQPFIPPLGGGVDRVAGPGGAAGHRRQVDQVAAAVAELVEERLGHGHGAQQVGLDHPPVVVVSV